MHRFPTFITLLAAALVAAGCGGASDANDAGAATANGDGSRGTVDLVAYSTPKVVYDEIIPAFARTPAGEGVSIRSSFGASGEQSRAVEAGQKADVVTFSTEPDVTRLTEAKLVGEDWNTGPNEGRVTTSVVSFIVREGNPKGIRTWADLLKPGTKVLTPNPFTSGAAKWNLLAAYGQASRAGEDPEAGLDYVRELVTEHVEVQPKSGREALQTFLTGDADVLLSYEYEATTAQKQGEDVEYVIPDDTIRIDIEIARTAKASAPAQAFLDYVLSRPAQERFADWGYRPVDERVLAANRDKFPTPPGLFTIEDLGGWPKVDDELFDPERGEIAKIESDAGVSTAR